MNSALRMLSPAERRTYLENEKRARSSGIWGPWEIKTFPKGSAGCAWAAEFTKAHKNKVFSVLDRTLPDGTRHLAITSLSGERPSWPEMQKIKSELATPESMGVEVYPPDAEIVDDADMYHLWILPVPLGLSIYDPPK
jgi:hypothetical protein